MGFPAVKRSCGGCAQWAFTRLLSPLKNSRRTFTRATIISGNYRRLPKLTSGQRWLSLAFSWLCREPLSFKSICGCDWLTCHPFTESAVNSDFSSNSFSACILRELWFQRYNCYHFFVAVKHALAQDWNWKAEPAGTNHTRTQLFSTGNVPLWVVKKKKKKGSKWSRQVD